MLKNVLALLTGAVTLILGIMFSVVVIAVLAALGLLVGGYFWWKTRKLRQAMRERRPGGTVIEGEAVVVEEYAVQTKEALPDDTRRP
jgi:hypothetical protein